MSWFSYFWPRTVARFSSPYNHNISLVVTAGKYKLLVGGSPQSGPYIETLWQKALRSFNLDLKAPIKKILILGVAGGTLIHLLRRIYPLAKIVGVEIDPVMLIIGGEYFGLREVSRLSLIQMEAREFIKRSLAKKEKFDLIIVDLYLGQEIPLFVSQEIFLRQLKRLLNPGGELIINFLRERAYRRKSEILLDKLQEIYHSVKDKEIFLNRFFYAQNQT
ncbi:MAG: spermidine synthase [Patescibacteria group bacterium]